MPALLRRACLLLGLFATVLATSYHSVTYAQPTTPAPPITSRFVPNDALAVLVMSPSELIASPTMAMFPIEVFRAQSLDTVGIDIADVATVTAIVGVPGPSGPAGGVVIKFNKDHKVSDLNPQVLATGESEKMGKYEVFAINGPPDTYLHVLDARTFIIAPKFYLDSVIEADKGTGALAKLVEKMPRSAGITLVAVLEPIRPMLSGYAKQQMAPQMPPPIRPLTQIPEWVDAVLVNTALTASGVDLKLSMLCKDDKNAEALESALTDSLQFGIEMAKSQIPAATAGGSERMQQAAAQYADRVSNGIAEMLKPARTGRRVTLNLKSDAGIASAGVMVGLLLPAVQAAREAARRMTASNGQKQVMLAMHNYAAAYGKLPAAAITDDDGKPLLSWRVSLLPFLEQQALYEQFHLDEAWDSPHNLPLSMALPSVYQDPSAPLPPGYTTFHAVVGDEIGLLPDGKTGFQNFTDGTSNSILIFESNIESAVPWSKPEDAEIDLDNPLAKMGNIHQGGFQVGFADGSVRFISSAIDQDLFKALLTRAGGEVVNGF